jgi:DNA-binding CsgD family transcriptional regulator
MANATIDAIASATGAPAGSVPKDALRAIRAGVLLLEGRRIRFTHPLFAAAVYSHAAEDERRTAHRTVAAAATGVEERARHLALGAEGPAEAVAQQVEEAARHAQARGAVEAATDLFELAARLTPANRSAERAARLIAAARSAHAMGDVLSAKRTLEIVLAVNPSGPLRARALLVRGMIAWEAEGGVEAVRLREEALVHAGDDHALRAEIHSAAAQDSWFDARRRAVHAQSAMEEIARAEDPSPRARSNALQAHAEAQIGLGRPLPIDAMTHAIELERSAPPVLVFHRAETILGWYRMWFDDFPAARASLTRSVQTATDEGDEMSVMHLHRQLTQLEFWTGNWAASLDHACRVMEMVEEMGDVMWRGVALARKALVEAHLGHLDAAQADIDESLRIANQRHDGGLTALCLWPPGALAMSLGNHEAADEWLSKTDAVVESIGLAEPITLRFHADHIEAVIRLGRLDEAERLLRRMEARGRRARRPWTLTTAARSRGLLLAAWGDLAGAERWLDRALVRHRTLSMPFELGRTLFVHGQVLRRARRKREARESLERAIETFRLLPAPEWERQARAEVARIGGRAPAPLALTETERRVAELAAAGRTSREIAAHLFMTVATVSANLTKIYRKTGVRSRAELAAHLIGPGTLASRQGG